MKKIKIKISKILPVFWSIILKQTKKSFTIKSRTLFLFITLVSKQINL